MMERIKAYGFHLKRTMERRMAGTKTIMQLCRRKGSRLLFIGTPLHGNLGDHAIAIAQRRFFQDMLEGALIIEIPGPVYRACAKVIQPFVREDDCIVISGGGFLGSLWPEEEEMVRDVLKRFARHKIMIMPQTVFFEKNSYGEKMLKTSREIYQGPKDLFIFLRDRRSYDFMREQFPKISGLAMAPDMVLYLEETLPRRQRTDLLLCLRRDKEQIVKPNALREIKAYIRRKEIGIRYTDTVLDRGIPIKKREAVFKEKLEEFKKSRLVITDRLHGMLFAAITGTPCIALDNLSGKVAGVYEWICALDYIRFINQPEDIPETIDGLLEKGECVYDRQQLMPYFHAVAKRLK